MLAPMSGRQRLRVRESRNEVGWTTLPVIPAGRPVPEHMPGLRTVVDWLAHDVGGDRAGHATVVVGDVFVALAVVLDLVFGVVDAVVVGVFLAVVDAVVVGVGVGRVGRFAAVLDLV